MIDFIFELVILVACAYWFYNDYQKAKAEGRSAKDYTKGIITFIALLMILHMIF